MKAAVVAKAGAAEIIVVDASIITAIDTQASAVA
jgi:hypothetical protein